MGAQLQGLGVSQEHTETFLCHYQSCFAPPLLYFYRFRKLLNRPGGLNLIISKVNADCGTKDLWLPIFAAKMVPAWKMLLQDFRDHNLQPPWVMQRETTRALVDTVGQSPEARKEGLDTLKELIDKEFGTSRNHCVEGQHPKRIDILQRSSLWLKLPALLEYLYRTRNKEWEIFLSYHSKAGLAVRCVRQVFSRYCISIWFDQEQFDADNSQRGWFEVVADALQKVEKAVAVVTPTGLGPVQGRELSIAVVRVLSRLAPPSENSEDTSPTRRPLPRGFIQLTELQNPVELSEKDRGLENTDLSRGMNSTLRSSIRSAVG